MGSKKRNAEKLFRLNFISFFQDYGLARGLVPYTKQLYEGQTYDS